MSHLTARTLARFADDASKWNDLWQRADGGRPSQRAEGVSLWLETFAPEAKCVTILVEWDDRYVAALPLIEDSVAGQTAYRLPTNCTISSGDLLVDAEEDLSAVIRLLAQQLRSLTGSFAILEDIDTGSEHWKRLLSQLASDGSAMHVSPGYEVGLIDILHDFDNYQKSWSRNHRSAVKRTRKKLEAEGKVEVVRMRDPSDEELAETLEKCFQIEDSGWKGDNGTSILKTPGLREYCLREARMMRDLGMLDLWLLELDGNIIAFEYCHFAKGTCFSHKISFDPAFERFSPGRLLRGYQLEQYHQDPEARRLDTLGIHCEAKAKWTTRTYRSGRCIAAIGGPLSNLMLRSLKAGKRWSDRLRNRDQEESKPIVPGAERYLEVPLTKSPDSQPKSSETAAPSAPTSTAPKKTAQPSKNEAPVIVIPTISAPTISSVPVSD